MLASLDTIFVLKQDNPSPKCCAAVQLLKLQAWSCRNRRGWRTPSTKHDPTRDHTVSCNLVSHLRQPASSSLRRQDRSHLCHTIDCFRPDHIEPPFKKPKLTSNSCTKQLHESARKVFWRCQDQLHASVMPLAVRKSDLDLLGVPKHCANELGMDMRLNCRNVPKTSADCRLDCLA